MPKSPNDPAECSAEKEDMITLIFDQVIGMGRKCVGCSWLWCGQIRSAGQTIHPLTPS